MIVPSGYRVTAKQGERGESERGRGEVEEGRGGGRRKKKNTERKMPGQAGHCKFEEKQKPAKMSQLLETRQHRFRVRGSHDRKTIIKI